MSDMTVNRSGPGNMTPRAELPPDGVTHLVDGFIRDKWIAPENREQEIAAIYRGQRDALLQEMAAIRMAQERRAYAAGWVDRMLDWQTALGGRDG